MNTEEMMADPARSGLPIESRRQQNAFTGSQAMGRESGWVYLHHARILLERRIIKLSGTR